MEWSKPFNEVSGHYKNTIVGLYLAHFIIAIENVVIFS